MKNDYKTRDYTLRGGKDAEIMNKRQAMAKGNHSASDNFVKSEQAKMMPMQGRAPVMEDRYMKFDACMVLNGAFAQDLAKKLTSGLDKVAFPVRQEVMESQD